MMAPTVRRDGLDGAMLAYDGQLIDDARLVVAVARTAAQHGATVLTRVAASDATGSSVRLTDVLTGEGMVLAARTVINATGVVLHTNLGRALLCQDALENIHRPVCADKPIASVAAWAQNEVVTAEGLEGRIEVLGR